MIVIVIFDHRRRVLPASARQHHIHLRGGYTAPIHPRDLDPDLRETQPRRHSAQPVG